MGSIKYQKGFAHLGLVLLVVLVLGGVVGAGYYVYHKNNTKPDSSGDNNSNNTSTVTSYDECIKAKGSVVQTSYPAVCVTADGKHFTQPTDNGGTSQKYLVIKEWGVKIPLGSKTEDAYYVNEDNGMMFISTKKLHALAQQVGGCHPGLDDVFLNRSVDVAGGIDTWNVKIGSFYYSIGSVVEPQCYTQAQDKLASQYQPIQKELELELQKVTAA